MSVTYLEECLPVQSHGPLITWSCKIMSQVKIMSPLPQYMWPPNLGRVLSYLRGSYSKVI